ncbi:MAG TPA: 50S ribosomal protein L24 [Anaerolineae bacterium]|nr:50S ribosomal protein L24 [Anaerolineae bacterium]
MAKIKKGDMVMVITGAHKGVRGAVQSVDARAMRVVVSGANIVKKHQKPVQAGRGKTQAGIIEFEAPINLSNVLLVCPKCNEPTRVGVRVDGESKVRVCKNCGSDIA